MGLTLELEHWDFDESDLIGVGARVRTGIRIYVDEVCITDPDERFAVADYLPGFCHKAAIAARHLVRGEDCSISLNATNCDIVFVPDESTVRINAYHSSGRPLNGSIPECGVEADTGLVIDELLSVSRHCVDQYEQMDSIPDDDRVGEMVDEVEQTTRTAKSRGFD